MKLWRAMIENNLKRHGTWKKNTSATDNMCIKSTKSPRKREFIGCSNLD